jgi:CubicO group peptidase (beta-lactamase class C family)
VAVALVDDRGVVWMEGFGYADLKEKIQVTPRTPFLVGGNAMMITAAAVMKAAQDGIVDLDEPITSYVPDFKVHSRYENDPASRITLRRLLSHTSGLPSAAPLGNFFEPAPMVSFNDHVESLFGSWLICPVGEAGYEGRLNYDLAAYILQTVLKQPIDQLFLEGVFAPLGMTETTVNRREILRRRDRAEGRQFGAKEVPVVNPFLGSGGAYSTAKDMARLVEMHINRGMVQGQRFLGESAVELMQTPMTRMGSSDQYSFQGLGMMIEKRYPKNTELILYNEGWGFGFTTFAHWYPEYGIGVVCLSNEAWNANFGWLALALTDQLIEKGIIEKRFPQTHPTGIDCVPKWNISLDHHPTAYRDDWDEYCGMYPLRFSDYKLKWWAKVAAVILGKDEWTPRIKVYRNDGFLCVTESTFFSKLGGLWPRQVEAGLEAAPQPGLFFTASGLSLDFRGETPLWGNYRLKK